MTQSFPPPVVPGPNQSPGANVPGFAPNSGAAATGPRPRASSVAIATLIIVCVLAALSIVITITSFGSLAASTAAPVDSAPPANDVFVDATPNLKPGDCLDTAAVKETATTVDCGSRHDAEVMGTAGITLPDDTSYPGKDQMSSIAGAVCGPIFESYVKQRYADSELEVAGVIPTAKAWKAGGRFVVCLGRDPDGNPLRESIRGSQK